MKNISLLLSCLFVLAGAGLYYGLFGLRRASPAKKLPALAQKQPVATSSVRARADAVELQLRRMSLEQRVGQMLMFGFSGHSLHPKTKKLLQDCRVGGVILFRGNIATGKQVRKLNGAVQSVVRQSAGLPALIATDQEGGRVVRLTPRAGVPIFAANGKLVRQGKIEKIKSAAQTTGRHLRAAGINMNLAPVLDVVTTPKRRGVIGDRSFSSHPHIAAQWGRVYIRTLQAQKVLATAKHFPGHGATTTDSHLNLPIVKLSKSALQRTHIAPFKAAIHDGVAAIMPAHIAYSAFDKDRPATLSHRVLHDLLRRDLKFEGIVISDSMNMAAVSKNRHWESTVVQAVRAGVDVLLIPASTERQRRAFRALVKAARHDKQMAARIEQSTRRILKTKRRFAIWN